MLSPIIRTRKISRAGQQSAITRQQQQQQQQSQDRRQKTRTVICSHAPRSTLTFLIICPRARQNDKQEKAPVDNPSSHHQFFCRRGEFFFFCSYLPFTPSQEMPCIRKYISAYIPSLQKKKSRQQRCTPHLDSSSPGRMDILADISALSTTTTSHTAACNRKGGEGTIAPIYRSNEGRGEEDKRSEEARISQEAPRNAVGPGQPFNSVVSYALGYRLFAKMIKIPTQMKTTHRNQLSQEIRVPGDSTRDGWYLLTHRLGGRREYPNRQHSMRHHQDLLPVSQCLAGFAQRPVCTARCAGFYTMEGFEFEQIVVIVAYILRARARTFVASSLAAHRSWYRAFAGWAACRPAGETRPDAYPRVLGPSGAR